MGLRRHVRRRPHARMSSRCGFGVATFLTNPTTFDYPTPLRDLRCFLPSSSSELSLLVGQGQSFVGIAQLGLPHFLGSAVSCSFLSSCGALMSVLSTRSRSRKRARSVQPVPESRKASRWVASINIRIRLETAAMAHMVERTIHNSNTGT